MLNLIESESLLKKFQKWLWKELVGYTKLSEAEERKIRKEVFIRSDSVLLLPLQDMDFIVYLGAELQRKLGNVGVGTVMKPDSIKTQVRRYFEVIGECLKEYGEDYYERFQKYGLVQKILTSDRNFMTLLAKAIEIHTQPENMPWIDAEWVGEESDG